MKMKLPLIHSESDSHAAPSYRNGRIGIGDHGVGVALAVAYILILIKTSPGLGYARDEGFYFQAAESYAQWFKAFAQDWHAAATPGPINGLWSINHEHPGLAKSTFAFCWLLFYKTWHLFDYEGTSFRFGGMLFAGGGLWLLYIWGARAISRVAGIAAALLFALMPRIFYHSHLACFDIPITAMWCWCLYSYWRSLEAKRWGWTLWTGVTFGLALATKHNAWFLPFAVLAHQAILRTPELWSALLQKAPAPARALALLKVVRPPPQLIAMVVIGPPLFILLWPWLWPDPVQRFTEYAEFHLHHDYYNMVFLGETYWKPPMPLGYAWVMTLATVPTITLVMFGTTIVRFLAHHIRAPLERTVPRVEILWLLGVLVSYSPWLSRNTPIFGGTKHWFNAYPFLCLLAACAVAWVVDRAWAAMENRACSEGAKLGTTAAIMAAILSAPLAETFHSHPWGLTNYTPLVGGAQGAASLGLNRGFWGFTTGAVVPFLNANVPPGQAVFIHDTAVSSWVMLQRDHQLRPDIRWTLSPAEGLYALYHHEEHMETIEYQTWVAYGTSTPAHVEAYDGVPVIWVYGPRAPERLR